MSGPRGGNPLGLPEDGQDLPVPDEMPDVLMLACRPCDVTGLPKVPGLDLTDIVTIEHIRIPCDGCERPVWIGPRQMQTWRDHQDRARRLCYWCAFVYLRDAGYDPGTDDFPLYSLGGGNAPKRGV